MFENIFVCKICWFDVEDCDVVFDEVKDLINVLFCMDFFLWFGLNWEEKFVFGGEEIWSYVWFIGVNWDILFEDEV